MPCWEHHLPGVYQLLGVTCTQLRVRPPPQQFSPQLHFVVIFKDFTDRSASRLVPTFHTLPWGAQTHFPELPRSHCGSARCSKTGRLSFPSQLFFSHSDDDDSGLSSFSKMEIFAWFFFFSEYEAWLSWHFPPLLFCLCPFHHSTCLGFNNIFLVSVSLTR